MILLLFPLHFRFDAGRLIILTNAGHNLTVKLKTVEPIIRVNFDARSGNGWWYSSREMTNADGSTFTYQPVGLVFSFVLRLHLDPSLAGKMEQKSESRTKAEAEEDEDSLTEAEMVAAVFDQVYGSEDEEDYEGIEPKRS